MKLLQNKKIYFLLSFIEGGSVMATELLGAKMLAPYFGSSLYVWATVLAVTLVGLAIGYFAGGILSYKNTKPLTLFNVLLAAAIFTIFMPYTSKIVLWLIGFHSLIPSVIFCASIILLPPVFMMGMVSPLLIRAITKDINQSGKASGSIYAISTLGGIIATFLFGFYIIPTFGLTQPSIFTGILLGCIPLFIIIKQKKIMKGIGFILIALWAFSISSYSSNSPAIKTIYASEGLLGQLLVLDIPHYTEEAKIDGYGRWLFVNRISQTMDNPFANESRKEEKYFTYVYRISEFADSLPKNSNILLLGLGGGSIAKVLSDQNFSVDVCELDKRIAMVAKKYFHLSDKVTITIDDARHYIKSCNKKYDLIIFDTFKGEDAPNHVFTIESLSETKLLLNPNGTVIVNSFGYIDGKIGKAMRSIYKTFLNANFNVEVLATDPNPDKNNLLFFASFTKLRTHFNFIPRDKIDLKDAVVLQDDYPILDILNAEAAHRWRSMAINEFNNDINERMLPLFQ